jgi:hypothetical protein
LAGARTSRQLPEYSELARLHRKYAESGTSGSTLLLFSSFDQKRQFQCSTLRADFGSMIGSVRRVIAEHLTATTALLKEVEADVQILDETLQTLKENRVELRSIASQNNTRDELRNNVYLLVGVIGLFGILSILSIYVFPDNVVMEWVSSGQVIQFVTVTILLSVVLSLGLSGILEQDTLGTLLGGHGGYVLSQGGGEQQRTERKKKQKLGMPLRDVTKIYLD